MNESATILVIEDDPHARTLLLFLLKQQGYRCLQASNGVSGVAAAVEREPSVVLLDLGLPDLEGREVTRRIRERSTVPIIVVSARGREEDKVASLDEGANDYVTKPIAAGELLARIRVALRATRTIDESPNAGIVHVGDLSVDFDFRRVTVRGAEVHLTPTEYRLISVMVRSAGRVVSSRQILRQVWGTPYEDQMGYLRIYMKKLRHKIEIEPAQPKYLVNEPGVGYRLRVPD
jgi:two-component system, OmpR family, KDP operon response regulator KdpE